MATENIKERKAYRILTDAVNKVWDKIYFLTNAKSVDAEDGKNLETKVGAIDGITDSLNSTSSRIAASAKAVNEINNSLGGFTPVIDDTGKITGYKTTKGGADTVFPFSSDFQSLVDSGKIKTASRAVSIRYKENNSGASGSVSFSEFNKIIGVVKVTNENYDRILCITNVSGNTVSYKQGYSPSGSDFWASSTITVIGY